MHALVFKTASDREIILIISPAMRKGLKKKILHAFPPTHNKLHALCFKLNHFPFLL